MFVLTAYINDEEFDSIIVDNQEDAVAIKRKLMQSPYAEDTLTIWVRKAKTNINRFMLGVETEMELANN